MKRIVTAVITLAILITLSACVAKQANMAVNKGNVLPGSAITKHGKELPLTGTPVRVGDYLPETRPVDSHTMAGVNFADYKGSVVVLSSVPSLETKVCEAQTHVLAEEGDRLPSDVKRIVLSRDTPMAQKRFENESGLTDVTYLSDYKEGAFGRATGLLIKDSMFLARSVIVVDKQGIVRYIQVVPEITTLPDMETAFDKAIELDSRP